MDLEYFKCQIEDELEGGKAYAKLAVENQFTHPEWSEMFAEMAKAEMQHAANLSKMMDEYYKEITSGYKDSPCPIYLVDIHKEATDMYMECSAKIKYILALLG